MAAALPFWQALAGSAPALIAADGSVITHEQLAERADALARQLAAPGKLLALLSATPEAATIVAYLALLRAGHAVLLLTPDSPALPALLATYRPDLLIGFEPQPGYAASGLGGIDTQRILAPAGEAPHPDLAVLLTTSGSTGSPKLVRLSHRAVAANAAQIVEALRMGPDDRAVTTLSPAYSFGLSVVNSHLLCGGSLLLTARTPLEREFWAELGEHGVTTLPGVPFTFDVVRRAGGAKLAPASLRKLIQAGGAMPVAVQRWLREAFAGRADLFVMYGQTEATARIAVLPPEEAAANEGSVGRPLPGGWAEIDADGQIVYHGPNVMMGYAECRADLARGDGLGGVLATGDLGRIGDSGLLWITGRLKRIAKPFGIRLNLDDIEAELAPLGSLAVAGDDAALHIFAESGDEAALRAAAQALAARLKLPASLVRLRMVAALPRTANGKIEYGRLGHGG